MLTGLWRNGGSSDRSSDSSVQVSGLLCEISYPEVFIIRVNWLYLQYNLKTKRMTKVLETGFTIWAISLGVMGAVGIVYAAVQVILGNVQHIVI